MGLDPSPPPLLIAGVTDSHVIDDYIRVSDMYSHVDKSLMYSYVVVDYMRVSDSIYMSLTLM